MKSSTKKVCRIFLIFACVAVFSECRVHAACVPVPSGLVGWWQGEGNADDSAGTNNGTLSPSGAGYKIGEVGQGFVFDGANGYVQIPDSDALKPANVTVEAWVWLDPSRPANQGGEQIVFKKNTWSAWFEGYSLLKETIDNGNGTYSDHFQFVVSRYGDQVIINSKTIPQRGVWYHVAATYDGNQSVLYVNGVAEASAMAGFALDYDTTPIYIGTTGTWAPYLNMFAGILDEVSIYNRALSSNEIAAIYSAGSAGKCSAGTRCDPPPSGIVGWWPGEGTGNDIIGGDNGVLSNGVAFANGEVGQAFSFDSSGKQAVDIPRSPLLSITNQVTIEFWMKADAANSMNSFQGLVTSDFYGISIDVGNPNLGVFGVDFFINDSGTFYQTANANGGGARLSAGVWHHIAGTYDGTQLQLYVDGQPSGNPMPHVGSMPPMPLNGFVSFGSEDGRVTCGCTDRHYWGLIDEPSIYNRALSASEIAAIYNAGSAGKCAPLVSPPVITNQPVSQTHFAGDTVNFNIGAGGTAPLTYHWSFNGTNLDGATNSTLTLSDVQPGESGDYAVLVTNLYGAATSSVASLTVLVPPTNCTPAPSGLVGWWQGEGNANDTAGANNGTLSPSGAGYAPGMVGQAFQFDGTNGYVQIPDSAALKPANVTVEAWVWLDPSHPANRSGEQIVFKKNTWSAWFEGYSLLKLPIDNGNGTYSDRFQFCVSRYGDQVAINSKTIVQRGVWYHVAATYDGNRSVLYVNGVEEASATPGFPLDYDTTPVYIGTTGTWVPYLSMFAGIIDEVSIYNRALSPDEIQSIYLAGSFGKCPPPVADATATTPVVISPNGSNAVVRLNGSKSYDPGGDPLRYSWFGASNNLLATGAVAVVTLPVGTNAITLTVNDGTFSDSQTIAVVVLTISQGIDQLIAAVNQDAAGQQSLVASLQAALASIDRSNPISAVNQLQAFQNKVNAQLGPIDPLLAQSLFNDAQAIINAIIAGGGGHAKVNVAADQANGKLRLIFAGIPGQSYTIEASSDMVHWQPIGVANDQGDGTFQFDDSQFGQNRERFYRVVP